MIIACLAVETIRESTFGTLIKVCNVIQLSNGEEGNNSAILEDYIMQWLLEALPSGVDWMSFKWSP